MVYVLCTSPGCKVKVDVLDEQTACVIHRFYECPACEQPGTIRFMDWSLFNMEPCGHMIGNGEYTEMTELKPPGLSG